LFWRFGTEHLILGAAHPVCTRLQCRQAGRQAGRSEKSEAGRQVGRSEKSEAGRQASSNTPGRDSRVTVP
jgi:hypothetical protein